MAQVWREAAVDGWICPFVDEDGFPCVEQAGHTGGHRDAGLRTWLEETEATAIVRVYEGADADHVYEREAALFARLGWRAIAGDDTSGTVHVGPSKGQVALFGVGAAFMENPHPVRRIAICFARPPLIAPGGVAPLSTTGGHSRPATGPSTSGR
jgi:hypothetical protein